MKEGEERGREDEGEQDRPGEIKMEEMVLEGWRCKTTTGHDKGSDLGEKTGSKGLFQRKKDDMYEVTGAAVRAEAE